MWQITFATSTLASFVRLTTLLIQEEQGMPSQATTLGSKVGNGTTNSLALGISILHQKKNH